MKAIYVETALYAYPKLKNEIDACDKYILRKAIGSVYNYNQPCEELCNKLVNLINRKKSLLQLKLMIEDILPKLTDNTRGHIFATYFYWIYVPVGDTRSRTRKRKRADAVIKQIGEQLELLNCNNQWFEEDLLKINFMRSCLNKAKRIKAREEAALGE